MTKAKTKNAKLAAKRDRAAQGLPDLAPVAKRAKQARKGGKFTKQEEDASIPALQARCRRLGRIASEGGMREMKAQWQGCEAGQAMARAVTDEPTRAILWSAIQEMRRIVLAYDRALGAPSRHATCLRLMLPTEAMEADAATPPRDERTDEERYRQAISGWVNMHGWLGYVEGFAASIALRSVIDDQRCADAGALVRALHCVADGMAGRRIVYRGA